MARQGIFTGFTPNDGLGDSLALGAKKVNDNFTEIYQTFGDGDNLSANAGSAGTWTKAGNSGIYTSKNVGIGTTLPTASLYVSGNVQLTGITTGTFVGDGSGLTGVTATGSGVVIKDSGVLVGVAQSINFDRNIDVTALFGGNATVSAADTVGFAYTSGFSTTSAYANVAGVSTTSGTAGFADTATLAISANFATVAGIVTYASASGVATNSGVAEYAKVAGVATYTGNAGFSTMAGYAHTAGIATVAQNLTGTPSIVIDNINSAIGIVTMPGQGSKMRFDFDATGDMPTATSWRGMFAWANNTKTAYVSSGTTMGGYNGWRKILHQDMYGNYQTVGVVTASKFAGDGSELTNLPSTDSIWRSNSTGINTTTSVGIGTTNTEGYKLKVVGNYRLAGRLDGTATDNVLPFLWSTYSSLPAAGINHGQFAHVHEYGKAYYAHNIGTTINVAVGTDTVGGQVTGVFYFNGVERPGSFPISRGATYILNQDDSTNVNYNNQEHPLMFSTSQDGELAGGDHYMMGVTYKLDGVIVTMAGYVSGFSSATTRRIEWTPVAAAPNTLWYWCHYHTGQGNTLSINNEGWIELLNKNTDHTVGTGTEHYKVGVLTATTLYGDGSNLSNIVVSFANTAGIATVAAGLTDKPDILVDNVNATGIVTAGSFVGDGSGLTGITASGSGIIIKEGGTLVGTIGTVNFGTGLSVSPASAGVVTVTASGGGGGLSGIVVQEESSSVGSAQTINFVGSAVTATYSGGVATIDMSGAVPFTGAATQITALDITQYETAYAWGNHATAGYLTGIGGQNLGNLSNVSSAAPSNDDVLTWNGSSWVPAAPTGGGGGGGINGITIKEEGTNVGTATSITSINFVGSGVTATATGQSATVTITAVTGGGGGGISTTGFGTYTASAGVETQIDSFSAASYSGAEYTFMIGLGTYRQSQKVLVMHDGTTAFSQEYGIMFSPEQQVSIGATIDSGNVQIKFTPEAGISGLSTYRYVKTLIQGI
jgi:hypothetical protein